MDKNRHILDGFATFELLRLFSNTDKYGKHENDTAFLTENIFKPLDNQTDEKLLTPNQFSFIDKKMTSITNALGLADKFAEMKQKEIEKGIKSHYGSHLYLQCLVSGLDRTEEGVQKIKGSVRELISEFATATKTSTAEEFKPSSPNKSQSTTQTETDTQTKACPFCAEEIKLDAKKCKHCGEWLDGSNQSTPSKSFLSKATDFVKDQKQKYDESKTAHLYIPTDEKPLEINGVNFFGQHFIYNGTRYEYAKIVSIKYFAEQNSTNFVTTNTKNEFLLFMDCGDNFPLENRLSKNVVDFSTSSFMGVGSGQKTREKLSFIYNYLSKLTFNIRIALYIHQIKSNGFFHYPHEHNTTGYKIFNNGDIQKDGKVLINIKTAFDNKKVEYTAHMSTWNNRSSYSNPYLLTFIQPGFFAKNTEIQMLYDKDIFDKILFQVFKTGKILTDS